MSDARSQFARACALLAVLAAAAPRIGGAQGMVPRTLSPDPAPPASPPASPVQSAVPTVNSGAAPVAPSTAPAMPAPASELDVTLVTFGLGEEVFERFGHNAIWLHDNTLGTDIAYDWGNFDFDQPRFIQRFLSGDTKYSMEGREAGAMLSYYQQIGRPITLQRLNLTPAQKSSLREFLRWNALEENKYYRYDYFRDNCSTRLRDALDRVLHGALQAATDTVTTVLTYRRESVRLTDGDRPAQIGIDIALGRPADIPLTAWQSFFIPMRLRDGVRDLTLATGEGGAAVRLVSDEQFLPPLRGIQPIPELKTSPRLAWRLFAVGLVLAALIVGLRIMAVTRRGAVWGLTLVLIAWSLLCGALGTIIILMWTATLHVFWGWNENLFQLSPLSLALVVLVPMSLLSRRQERAARTMAFVVAGVACFGMLLSALPGGQENRAIVALFLPVHLAFAWAVAQPTLAAGKPKPPKEKKFTI